MVGYSYDNNGNQLTTPDGATLEYDPDNRMTKWTRSGQVEQYQYHPSGWRMQKAGPSWATYFYGPGGQLLSALDGSVGYTDYVYFGGRLLFTLGNGEHGYKAVTRVYTDRLGSTRATETVEWMWQTSTTRNYYPFGEEMTAPQGGDQYKFASTYRDSATGLDYAVNRYYASGTGRFLTTDPAKRSARLRKPGSWNRYSYGSNDPINHRDPRGLEGDDEDGGEDEDCWEFGECEPGGGGEGDPPGGTGPDPSSTGGASPPPTLHVSNISKSGTNYNSVRDRLNQIVDTIDPDCLSFLESGGNKLSGYVSGMLSNGLLAVADFDKGIAAFNGSRGTDMPEETAAIVVNSGSAFFDSAYSADQGKIKGGTARAQAFILLHELGHGLGANDFVPDLDNKDAGRANDQMIEKNCDNTLKGLK